MNTRKYALVVAVAAWVVLLAACASSPPPPKPTIVRIDLTAADSVNADVTGRGMPVVLRYYLLQSTGAFDSADYFSLFERDDTVLAASKVLREELTLRPGQRHSVELRPLGDAHALGVFVAFRDFNQTLWRATAPVPQNMTTSYSIRVDRNSVSITPRAY